MMIMVVVVFDVVLGGAAHILNLLSAAGLQLLEFELRVQGFGVFRV